MTKAVVYIVFGLLSVYLKGYKPLKQQMDSIVIATTPQTRKAAKRSDWYEVILQHFKVNYEEIS